MSIWDNEPLPDGTLAVTHGAWSIQTGTPIWHPRPLIPVPSAYANEEYTHYPQFRTQRCVWLEAGLISADDDLIVRDYEDYFYQMQRREDGLNYYSLRWPKPEKITFRGYIQKLLSTKSQMQIMRDQEHLRPITNEERLRFAEKQKCIRGEISNPSEGGYLLYPDMVEKCDPYRYPPWPTDW